MIFAISSCHDNKQCVDKIIDFACHHLMTKPCRNVFGAQQLMKPVFSAPWCSPTEAVLLLCFINAKEKREMSLSLISQMYLFRCESKMKSIWQAIIKIVESLSISSFRLLPMSTSPMSWLIRKGWNSCWYSARMPYMVQWLQTYCTITNLASIGFEINPYDPCVVSKTVNGARMTICFHVDDCKLSHHSSKANNNIINWLYQEYESIFEDRTNDSQQRQSPQVS